MKIRWLFFIFLITIYGIVRGQNIVTSKSELALEDRWIECDLLWFKPDNIQGSIDEYFSRISPLYGNSLGEKGIVQVISVLPKSYPGQSLLTEDEGILLGEDNCKCGRKGKYFKILGRIKSAELRGCSDTYGADF